jgi:hypothetical protein
MDYVSQSDEVLYGHVGKKNIEKSVKFVLRDEICLAQVR